MKDNDLLVLLVGAAVLFFLWKKKNEGHAIAAAGAAGALTTPSPAGPTAGLTGDALIAAKKSGQPFRAVTANGTAGGVPFGQMAVNRNAPRPPDTTYKSRTATSSGSSSSKLDKVQGYFETGARSYLQGVGVPSALARPIAKYGNTVADIRYAGRGAAYVGRGVATGARAVGSAATSSVKAVGSFFSSIF